MSPSEQDTCCFVGDDDSEYFRVVSDRKLNVLSSAYLLPCDEEEIKRYEYHHRLIQFLFSGNYIGPVQEVMSRSAGRQRRVLDLGTGAGHWAMDTADEFPWAEIIGVDLAPIQPRIVPPNCTFELFDIDQGLDYPDDHFDLIHARGLHTGIRQYSNLVREIYRLLVPGGLVIMIEPDLIPLADGKSPSHTPDSDAIGVSSWFTLWETYRSCLKQLGIDTSTPQRLADMLSMRDFDNVFKREANIPVGFWPTDPDHLTVGQLQWMDYDLLLPALQPLFLSSGLSPTKVESIIADAQHDLYHPSVNLSARIHIVHAQKPV